MFFGENRGLGPLTLLSVALWGTAFPGVKFGYQLFQIDSSSSGAISSLLLFAGLRFMIAGLLTLIVTGVIEKRVPWPKGKAGNWGDIALLGVFQTILQYSFSSSACRTRPARPVQF